MIQLTALALCSLLTITAFPRNTIPRDHRQNPEVKRVFSSAGDLILKPDHYEEQNAPPEWHYYEIWMQIRKQLSDMF